MAAHAVPADIELLQTPWTPDQLAQLFVIGLIEVDIDKREASDKITRWVEHVQQITRHFGIHFAVHQMQTPKGMPRHKALLANDRPELF